MLQIAPAEAAFANVSEPLNMELEDTSLEAIMHAEDVSSRQQSSTENVSHSECLDKMKELSRTIQLLKTGFGAETEHPAETSWGGTQEVAEAT